MNSEQAIPSQQPVCHAELVSSRGVHRVLRLSGMLEATLEYNGQRAGCEEVLVDGQVVARVLNKSIWPLPYYLVPRIEFTLPGPDGPVAARIDLQTAGFRRLGGFQLRVADRVVYAEGIFLELVSRELPLPAAPPGPAVDTLPIPGSPADPHAAPLPIPGAREPAEARGGGPGLNRVGQARLVPAARPPQARCAPPSGSF